MINTIQKRQTKEKELIIEQLKKTPIVQIAAEKAGIGRATYYRWKKEDSEFSQKAEEALQEGSFLVNDIAESQLMSAIKDKNLTAIIFWLKHHHPAYLTKVEITSVGKEDEKLTSEQEESVKKALIMAGIIPAEVKKKQNEQ